MFPIHHQNAAVKEKDAALRDKASLQGNEKELKAKISSLEKENKTYKTASSESNVRLY